MQATHLLCNHLADPLGVDTPQPQFAWRCGGQRAWRVTAAVTAEALETQADLLWDSGRVEGGNTQNIRWGGGPLPSGVVIHWRVQTWGEGDQASWSEPARFETSLLHPEDWHAHWIAPPPGATPAEDATAPLLRTSFRLAGPATRARLYVCGLGYFTLTINGRPVDDARLDPPFTAYDRTCLYRVFDVTALLQPGENVVAVVLGNGMYNVDTPNAWDFEKAPWRHHPKLLLQGFAEIAAGTVPIATGSHWRTTRGPIVYNNLYVGETCDARRELPGWNAPGFDDSDWAQAIVCRSPGGRLRSLQMPSIRVVEKFAPARHWPLPDGAWVFDLGRNIAGWVRLRVRAAAGTMITLKHTELLADDGDVDDQNIRAHVTCESIQQDTYICKGGEEECYEPRFTYHGFRYVRVSGLPGEPDDGTLTACIAHTDLPEAGGFECSHDLVNRLHAAVKASTENNYHGIPTDCPHREKNGWTGDAVLSSEQVLLNYDPRTAYGKWLDDILDAQRPDGALPGIVPTGGWGYNWGSGPMWDSVLFFLPWNLYLYTGDREPLERCWGAMERYLRYLDTMSEDGTLDFGLGDWCSAGRPAGQPKTPTRVSDTWYYLADNVVAAKVAGVLGLHEAAARCEAKAEWLRRVFRQRFIDEGTGTVTGDCMTVYALALHWGIVAGELQEKVLAHLVAEVEAYDRHFDCGILGTKTVLQALSDHGRADLAFALATQTTYPSFGEWIERGSNTLWESFEGRDSHNHHMFSDVGAFFYKTLAGIRPDEGAPGFRHTVLAPQPVDGLDFVRAWHETPHGTLRCAWQRTGEGLTLDIEVPAGTTATLRLPGWRMARVEEATTPPMADALALPGGCHRVLANRA